MGMTIRAISILLGSHPIGRFVSTLMLSPGKRAEAFRPLDLTLALLDLSLIQRRPTHPGGAARLGTEAIAFRALQRLHSGLVGDYVAWMALGLAGFAAAMCFL